ncbi:MAG TPA: hypothetical protein VGC32_06845 [Solirubrobacterales bacterium]
MLLVAVRPAAAATQVGETCSAEVLSYGTVDTFFSLIPSASTVTGPGVITILGRARLQGVADVDGDGYGDETQDGCPTDGSTHGPCPTAAPTPPPVAVPIALSASAAAKKSFLTMNLTTTAQASVSVTGSVKLGKGKPVKLKGNTQIIAPGALAKFTLLFPAKLKAALKKLPTNRKLTVDLSASAPGAPTKTLTVKIPGQMEVGRHPGGKA